MMDTLTLRHVQKSPYSMMSSNQYSLVNVFVQCLQPLLPDLSFTSDSSVPSSAFRLLSWQTGLWLSDDYQQSSFEHHNLVERLYLPLVWSIHSKSTPQQVRSRLIVLLLTLRLWPSPDDNYKKWYTRKNGRNVSIFNQIWWFYRN
jgi:hypothetical protein